MKLLAGTFSLASVLFARDALTRLRINHQMVFALFVESRLMGMLWIQEIQVR